ncbi:MAG TPA: glycosyltransferase [Oceanipulchritudo sp.]|nr:glycosyltransferase [Oceanipulchritudo sp.]
MSLRVLVLTSSTGSGHDMRAKAFAKWVDALYGSSVEVHIEQIIENSSWLGRFGVWIYNTIHRFCPFLHNIYFFIVEVFISSHSGKVSFGGRYYRQLLTNLRPDIVFSVHDSTNYGYFEDAKRLLGEQVRCVTYCGEFSGGYGYSRNWVNPAADLFIARTSEARDYAVRLGMPIQRTRVFHKLLPPVSFTGRIPEEEKADHLRQLGFNPDRFTVFLATGGYGANHHQSFLRALLGLAERVQVIVICGRNQRVFDQLTQWARQHPHFATYVEGYSSRVADFLQLSDAIVTRGGANTTMEALHFGCPILYNALGGLMPQERCTVRYFVDHGAARMIHRPNDLAKILHDWSTFSLSYQTVRERLDSLHAEENPRDLVRQIVGESVAVQAAV